jgi:sugar/nucleoside kinase (ribokinase family)
MMYDVVCAGAVYLDLTFAGLDGLPRAGEERWARELLLSPGGMANTAVGLSRLGLNTALVAPMGRDMAGQYLRGLLENEGISCEGQSVARSAMTAVMPVDGDRALVSFEPHDARVSGSLGDVQARAMVRLLDESGPVSDSIPTYAVTSHAQVHAAAVEQAARYAWVHALITNEQEALALSGARKAEDAAGSLSERAGTAVVTLGSRGAIAASEGCLEHVQAPRVDVRDATGAGDLFAAAYVWADLQGLSLRERLRWATLYAALSLRTLTAFAGAVRLAELQEYARRPSPLRSIESGREPG